MRLVLQLVAGFLLMIWPMAMMMSPMAFDAPGSTSNKSVLLPLIILVFYPVLIGLVFYMLSWSFFSLSPRMFLIMSLAVPAAAFTLFGYPRLVFNMYRGVSSEGYFENATAVYYEGAKLAGADVATFTVLDGWYDSYARDRTHVYYQGKQIKGADSTSFTPILRNEKDSGFWRDASHVFRNGKQVAGADPNTLEVFEESMYARDQSHAYYDDKLIEGADGATFALLSSSFGRDKTRLYFLGRPILPSADLASFELLEGADFGRDAGKVYALPSSLFADAHEIVGADRATFTPLARAYAKDAAHVYYPIEMRAAVIPNADAATFTVTEWDQATQSEARDKQHHYLRGKPVL